MRTRVPLFLLSCVLATVPASTFANDLDDQEYRTQPFAPGEIIIKFKDDAVVGSVAKDLLEANQPFATITDDGNLDLLNRRYGVTKLERIWKRDDGAARRASFITKQMAIQQHRLARALFKRHVLSVLSRKATATKVAHVDVPFIENTYKITLRPIDNDGLKRAIGEYSKDPNIEYAQPNFTTRTQMVPNDPYYSSVGSWGQAYDDLWALKLINAAQAWDISQGEGVLVAVVDSGVDYNHEDLAANMWRNYAEIPGDGLDNDRNGFVDDVSGWDFAYDDNDPLDNYGHGTHVAGTIAAVGNNNLGIIGVAPKSKIMPLKGINDADYGAMDWLANAMKYAADNGADVINNSWACSQACPSNPIAEDAVRYAYGLGLEHRPV